MVNYVICRSAAILLYFLFWCFCWSGPVLLQVSCQSPEGFRFYTSARACDKKNLSNGYKAHLHQDKYFVKQQIDFYHSLNSKHIQSDLILCVGLSLHEIKQT